MHHGIGNRATQDNGVGIPGDPNIDEIELSGLPVYLAIRKPHPDLDRVEAALIAKAFPQLEYAAHRYRKRHVHRIGTDNSRQSAAGGTNDISDRNCRSTDAAIDWRSDLGIIEIDLRLMKLSFRRLHLRRR